MANKVTEEQIKYAMDMIAKKNHDVSVIMYDHQNLSTVDHHNADLHQWLSGMTADGYSILIERLEKK